VKKINVDGPYKEKYAETSFVEKLRRTNYDIHVSAIAGFPGMQLSFFLQV
jgi:hypothetical protein